MEGSPKAKKFLKAAVPSRNYHEIKNEFDGKPDISIAGNLTSWTAKLSPAAQEWIAAVKRGQDSMTTETINNSIRSFYQFWSKQ